MDSLSALLFASIGTIIILAVGWYVLQAIAYWKIFEKAGEPGWKALIPIYNSYIQYKFTWNPNMFWIVLVCSLLGGILGATDGALSYVGSLCALAATIVNIIAANKLAKAFGHGVGFTIGLFFLNPIFMLILGFSSDEYIGPQ